MTGILLSGVHESLRKPLAACVASIFALTAPTATLARCVFTHHTKSAQKSVLP
jgi:hypothetical protein